MSVADMAARAHRDVGRAGIGTDLNDPNIDYATHTIACTAARLSWSLAAPPSAQTAATPPTPPAKMPRTASVFPTHAASSATAQRGTVARFYPRIARVQRGADNFVRYVRQPAAMAAYSEKQISNAQLLDIYAFLRAPPAPTAVKDTPLLNQLKARGHWLLDVP